MAVLIVLGGLGFLRRVPEFLNDIGAAGLLLVVVWLLVRAQERRSPRTLLVLPPVVLAAFYLRYGVVGSLCAIAPAALVAYGWRGWRDHGRHLAAAAGMVLMGLLPHFVYATRVTGWPLGLIVSATDQANRAYVGDGLVYYLAVFPYRLAGDLGAVVMTAGLLATAAATRVLLRAAAARRRGPARPCGPTPAEPTEEQRRTVFLGLASVGVFVVLGLVTDGEPRFVYLPVLLLTLLGTQAVTRAAGPAARAVLVAVAALAALTVAGTVQVVLHGAMPGPTTQGRSTVPVARALAAPADGGPCLIVTGYEPESGWYSGCDAVTYAQYRRLAAGAPPVRERLCHTRVSFVRYRHGRLQPTAAGVRRLSADRPAHTVRLRTAGSLGSATVVTVPAAHGTHH